LNNDAFKRHMAKGFVTYHKDQMDPEKLAADMDTRDGCAPLVPGDERLEKAEAKIVEDKPITIRERLFGKHKG
jgi:hypothetical protein